MEDLGQSKLAQLRTFIKNMECTALLLDLILFMYFNLTSPYITERDGQPAH